MKSHTILKSLADLSADQLWIVTSPPPRAKPPVALLPPPAEPPPAQIEPVRINPAAWVPPSVAAEQSWRHWGLNE